MSFKCYIVDDEPLAIKVIEQHLQKFEEFKVLGTATDPLKAYSDLKALDIDLLFVDIEMPELNGIELIKSIDSDLDVIITTAYRDYAVEGFEMKVLDYLVKPIPIARFLQSIEKFKKKRKVPSAPDARPDHIFIRADRKSIKVALGEILYIEGVKDYVRIVAESGSWLTKLTLGGIHPMLPDNDFIRIHKSFIVSKDKITAFTSHDVEIGDIEIPIGRAYKEEFERRIRD